MNNYYQYHYNDSELMAVPAVHHQSAFAVQVHNICCDPVNRPDAIAVELGHAVVIELVKFLKKIKQGGVKKTALPCMLGLMVRNNYIHPDHYEKALLLQEFYSEPLYNLPDDILAERLNFTKWSTLFISPIDSIVEAIRCAIELNIPVYGVDIGDFANTAYKKYSIEDPQSAHSNIVAYGDRLMKYCETGRDLHIDLNREVFMAAGLKYCLTKHKKVLFTCGLAHWKSIVSLLDDPLILPFPVHKNAEKKAIRRVIIHPALAAQVMEIIPQVTFEYEQRRSPVTAGVTDIDAVDAGLFVRNILDETFKKYTSDTKTREFNLSGSERWSNIGLYAQYLFHLSAVKQRKIPDASTLISAAEVMMDDEFCRSLTQQLMRVSPDWASPKDFPDLPVISQSENNKKGAGQNNANTKVRVSPKKKKAKNDGFDDQEKEFFIRMPGNSFTNIGSYWKWAQHNDNDEHGGYRHHLEWVWPPCESLLFGIAYKAAEISNTNQNRFSGSKTFEGSMEGGIDIKATIRSLIRGERKTYVNKLASSLEQSILDGVNPDPFVIIFQKATDSSQLDWRTFHAGQYHQKYIKDLELYHRIASDNGDVFVASVMLQEHAEPPEQLRQLVSGYSKLHGALLFGNPCINSKQSSIWIKASMYKCCPILFDGGMSSLENYYLENYKLELNLSDWHESLIRMAIPFAKKSVTIIAYDSFHFSERVRTEAERKRVSLNLVSYSNFSESQLDEARRRFTIRALDEDGNHFPPETETLLGQTKETYFEMLPYAIRKQVGYDEEKAD